jgi:HEAT repeat protein
MVRIGRELSKAGKPEYETVVKSMETDGDEDVKLAALYALQNMGDAEALKTLIGLYDKTESAKLMCQIVFMLQDFE